MEDISRELEREIAKSKPKPFKKNRKIKILVVDNFGKVISGDHMKILLMVLSFISIVTFLTSAYLFYHYYTLSREAVSAKTSLILAEKKISELTGEKEVLMARLVILGKEPGVKKILEKDERPLSNDQEEKAVGNPVFGLTLQAATERQDTTEAKVNNKTISIEKFIVTRDRTNKDVLVQFGVRNISKEQGDISGRIFTVLQPDNNIEEQWLVVPAAKLKKGIPIENQNGQYFSIAHFKPVKFKIKSEVNSDFYKKASIFIFNIEGELVFEKTIDITETE
jgi:hypothetical protein